MTAGASALPAQAALREILQAGVRAPTADNHPVLRYQLHDDRVALWAEPAVATPVQPHRRAFGLLAAGAMIENMALRSTALGWSLQVEPLLQPALLAVLRWRPADVAPRDPLDAAIEDRHTNRRFYRRTPVSDASLAVLTAAAAPVPQTSLQWLGGETRREALQAIRRAEAERFRRPALHAELFGSVRFELGWHATAEEGLPPAVLEVEPPLRSGFALLRHWPVMRAAGWLGAPALLGLRAGWAPCALAPRLGLVAAREDAGEAGWLQAGRAFERLWLAAQAEGLALQPMAAAVALALQRPGDGWVSSPLQHALGRSLQRCVGPGWQACMLFRLGHANKPAVVTGRRLLSHYIAAPEGGALERQKSQSNQQPHGISL